MTVPPPTFVKLLICCATPLLWLKLVAESSPQCAQSTIPSLVRSTVAGVTPTLAVIDPLLPPPLLTVTVTSSLLDTALSSPVSRSTYVPAAEKLAVVLTALAFAKLTVPGPLTFDQTVVTAPGGLGNPSSVTLPASVALDGSVIV